MPCADLLIIGGGSSGAALAYEAVRRGLKVTLLEAEDPAVGTSSRSTKLLHGGVRYLELAVKKADPAQFKLVREALVEREARHQQLKLARESALARYNGITQEQKRYEFSEAVPPPNSLGFAQLVSLLAIFFVTFLAVFLASLLRRQE